MTRLLFAPAGPRRLALIRIALGIVLLCHAGCRWRYAVELYSTWGPAMPLFPAAEAIDGEAPEPKAAGNPAAYPRFHGPVPSPSGAVVLHTLLLFALTAVTAGWQTRTSLMAAAGLLAWLGLSDGAATFAKHIVISLHLLVLLACSGCGRAWSIDALAAVHRGVLCPLQPVWPRRMLQLLVCAVYFGAAMTKLRTPAFLTGDLLTFSLLDDYWGGGPLGIRLSSLPRVVLLLSLATVLFELLFPFLIWVRRLRGPMLAAAFLFHAGMAATMHLSTFSPTMLVALLAFLREDDLTRWRLPGIGGKPRPFSGDPGWHRRLLSVMAYSLAAAVFVAAGSLAQRHFDWYGAFGRRPLDKVLALPAIDEAQWAEMRAERQPAWEDYIHRTAIGKRTSGTQVFGGGERFRHWERAYVVVQFIPVHPELRVEGLLIGPDGVETARFTHRVPRNVGYSVNGFELTDDLPAGTYRVVLQVEGFEFAERTFELVP